MKWDFRYDPDKNTIDIALEGESGYRVGSSFPQSIVEDLKSILIDMLTQVTKEEEVRSVQALRDELASVKAERDLLKDELAQKGGPKNG